MKSDAPPEKDAPLIATSKTVARTPGLSELLGRPVLHQRDVKDTSACSGVIAWGLKPSAAVASAFAKSHGLALLRLEDGFLRSVAIGSNGPPLSIVLDDIGIYYDASAPSRLERLIPEALTADQRYRTQTLICAWRSARVSKYNHAREYTAQLLEPYVLVADQVAGDASISYGLADQSSFQRMLTAALHENPKCTVVLKTHPDVIIGRKQGHFDLAKLANEPRIMIIAENVHPVSLIERATAVYCVTSQIGFEGLLWGKRVHTFGMPFYAGWGLTCDALPAPDRRHPVALEYLAHAALIGYPRYIDPETGHRCEPERLIAWMGLQRKMRERFPAVVDAVGFSFYKKPIVRRFFQGSQVFFNRNPADRPEHATLAVWRREAVTITANPPSIIQLEDGFIRSVGLGADLIHPLSWAMDTRGIYYDATQPSDLEHILQHSVMDIGLTTRAESLREHLVAYNLTKYNVGTALWQRPVNCSEHKTPIILVPGQVESDASLSFGAPGIQRNLDLLQTVRTANPDSYIVYKPHPDIVAGLRKNGQDEDQANRWCDEIVIDVSMGHLLAQVDEVHTMTSLTGFETLLRGKKVVCYGLPFYAGWGLTEDRLSLERRTRKLTLNELVAGVLILYPTYVSRTTGKFTTPERALDELLDWREHNPPTLPWWRKGLRWILKIEMLVKDYCSGMQQ
ncbi:MAG: hypothetical protein Q8N96_16355 [Methylovulum sp.]|nr:hypothetical protein [Methylovulum sp.]